MRAALQFLLLTAWLVPAPLSFAGGTEVVVIYNSAQPDSKALADFYARKRNVPKTQILGFALPDGETISRADFRDRLQRPLAKKLEDLKLWRYGRGTLPGTNGTTVPAQRKVIETKIRYLVLCYGVPLKILPDTSFKEAAEENLLVRTPLRHDRLELGYQILELGLALLDEDAAVLVHADDQGLLRRRELLAPGFGQVHRYANRQEGRRHHEDDQQNQHDVHERRDVDLVHGGVTTRPVAPSAARSARV